MTAVTPGHKGNQFNFVTSARRQPGSTFKTIALTTAVARGMDPFRTSYLSAPLHYQPDSTCNPSDPNCAWDVADVRPRVPRRRVGRERDGAVRQHACTRGMSLDVGPENIVAMARKLGIRTSPLDGRAVDRARLGRGDAARARVGVFDDRSGRRSIRSRWRSRRSCSRTARPTRAGTGASRSANA